MAEKLKVKGEERTWFDTGCRCGTLRILANDKDRVLLTDKGEIVTFYQVPDKYKLSMERVVADNNLQLDA